MSDFLTTMAACSRRRAEEARMRSGVSGLASRASSAMPPVTLRLSDEGFDLIAEPKLASPSEGRLVGGDDDLAAVTATARELAGAGPVAISVLTEPTRFDGDLGHLESVAAVVGLPVMRKDFLVDPVQVLEARAAGASGVLLVARIVEPGLLAEMTDLALSLGMFALVEVFEEADLEVAESVLDRPVLVGVNARDLATLAVDPTRHAGMAPLLPAHLPHVAESGIFTPEDAAAVAEMGYRLALVGTGLVGDRSPQALASRLIAAGREAAMVGGPR